MTEEEKLNEAIQLDNAGEALIDFGVCTLTDFANPQRIGRITGIPQNTCALNNKYMRFEGFGPFWDPKAWMGGGILDRGDRNQIHGADAKRAFLQLRNAAIKGESKAQLDLGLLYFLGLGVKRNFFRAEKWLRKAANKKSIPAIFYLACVQILTKSVTLEKAKRNFIYAAEQKYIPALIALAFLSGGEFEIEQSEEFKLAMQIDQTLASQLFARSYRINAAKEREWLYDPLHCTVLYGKMSADERSDCELMGCASFFHSLIYSGKLHPVFETDSDLFPNNNYRGKHYRGDKENDPERYGEKEYYITTESELKKIFLSLKNTAEKESDSANSGLSHLRYSLGTFYATGMGTEVNLEQAVYWWEKACGEPYAHHLAACFLAGFYFLRSKFPEELEKMFDTKVVSQNPEEDMNKAAEWFSLSKEWSPEQERISWIRAESPEELVREFFGDNLSDEEDEDDENDYAAAEADGDNLFKMMQEFLRENSDIQETIQKDDDLEK